jgi:hypothetical protein
VLLAKLPDTLDAAHVCLSCLAFAGMYLCDRQKCTSTKLIWIKQHTAAKFGEKTLRTSVLISNKIVPIVPAVVASATLLSLALR